MVQTFLIQGCWNGCSVGVSSTVLRIWAGEQLVDIQIGFVTDHRDKATDESKGGRDEGLGLLLHKTLLEGKWDFGCTCLWQQSLHTRGEDLKDLFFSVHLKQWTLSTVVCCVGGYAHKHIYSSICQDQRPASSVLSYFLHYLLRQGCSLSLESGLGRLTGQGISRTRCPSLPPVPRLTLMRILGSELRFLYFQSKCFAHLAIFPAPDDLILNNSFKL